MAMGVDVGEVEVAPTVAAVVGVALGATVALDAGDGEGGGVAVEASVATGVDA